MTTAALIEKLGKLAQADGCRFTCDRCHQAMGVRFADRIWACQDCIDQIYLKLSLEQAKPLPRRKHVR